MRGRCLAKWMLGAVLLFSLLGCSAVPPAQNLPEPSAPPDQISFEGTTFKFNDEAFDITEREPSVNTIMDCTVISPYIIVEGHIGPKNGYYGIFNTITQSFEKDIYGCNLIYYNNDVDTIVYSFWNEIYAYDGSIIATCDMEEGDHIYGISFIDDNTRIQVEILDADAGTEAPVEVIYDL